MPHLLLLHGALGARDQFAPLLPLLGDALRPHLLDFEGHGTAAARGRAFRIEHFAENAAEGWEAVLDRTAELMRALGERPALGPEALATVRQRVRVAVGDRDATVAVEEAAGAYRAMPNAELEVPPATPHPLEKAPLARLARSVAEFFA